jgi:enamine deaminase RidA (YjgF/YER057c/UK114 family)
VTRGDGVEAARIAALNMLAVLEHALGSLDRLERLLTVNGYIACRPSSTAFHLAMDRASSLPRDVLGNAGQHMRTVVGVAALARGASVEIEVIASVRD